MKELDMKRMKDSQGRYRTNSLFKEWCRPQDEPLYTLEQVRKVYLECKDPTGYKAAMILLGDWRHWEKLSLTSRFKELLKEWNDEIEIMLRSEAITNIAMRQYDPSPSGLSAAKFLAESKWKESTRGRPSKEEIKRKAAKDKSISDKVKEDVARLNIKAVNNNE